MRVELAAELAKQCPEKGQARGADARGGPNASQAASDEGGRVRGEQRGELRHFDFRSQNRERLGQQPPFLPRSPSFLLEYRSSFAAADGYLFL